jgi:F0F1-type ATP synthase membrane subunit b/b'
MKKTKIVATLGPACADKEILRQMFLEGLNVCRLNFSHGAYEAHAQVFHHLRQISKDLHKPIAIMQDLCGPKIRLGKLPPEGLMLEAGTEVTFVLQEKGETIDELPLPLPTLFAMMRCGETILINDGRVKLTVTSRDADRIRAHVNIGGLISSHKGVNLPATPLPVSSITEKDLMDLRFGIQLGVDWVAVSFVLFFVLLGSKLWKAGTGALDSRTDDIRKRIDEANKLRLEAEAKLKEAEAARAEAVKEAAELLARAKAQAANIATAAAAEAEASAERRKQLAMQRITAAEASAIAEVRNTAADIAAAATRAVLAETMDAAADGALIDRSVADLPRALRVA